MTVYLRFLAFSNRLPRSFAPFTLPDGSKAEDLIREVQRQWAEAGVGTQQERDDLEEQALLASEGRVLQPEEPLAQGQQISVIGSILGG
jgi:hypothetical protein